MVDKFSRYLLIAILIVVLVVLYFVFTNKKEVNAQSDLLLAMADKLGSKLPKTEKKQIEQILKSKIESNTPRAETKEDGPEIVRIAEKIYNAQELTQKEKDFQAIFPNQISEEVEFSKTFHSVVKKVLENIQLSEEENTFYKENKEMIDQQVDQSRNPSTINHKPLTIQGANPPLALEERKKMILGFFLDGIPKNITELSHIYAGATGTQPSKGNISGIFGNLEGDALLCQKLQHNSRWKVYYGLPEWFENGKLKKEFKNKIQ